MKIITDNQVVISKHIVEHKKERYLRLGYQSGKTIWLPQSYDGECNEEKLEKEFQKEFQKELRK